MDPIADVTIGLKLLDLLLGFIAAKKAQAGLTTDEIVAHADTQDLANKDAIKALLAA